ncbi:hypothetical protein [Mycobacterium sp. OTB74]|uniref:hypothetical protein n=1 Tax=Mycobacterium sp. OTB74 TaxID=1853452 RepID=UPI002473C3ED|nr:hypothetical protein [Mycobacterium sp. OTB74]MDH6243897.1 hypothetical protein [Mycobacterium sp. OTB74]
MTSVVKAAQPASLLARIIHFVAQLLLSRVLIRALTSAGWYDGTMSAGWHRSVRSIAQRGASAIMSTNR